MNLWRTYASMIPTMRKSWNMSREHVEHFSAVKVCSKSLLPVMYSLWKLLLTIRSAISCLFPAACLHVAVTMPCRRS